MRQFRHLLIEVDVRTVDAHLLRVVDAVVETRERLRPRNPAPVAIWFGVVRRERELVGIVVARQLGGERLFEGDVGPLEARRVDVGDVVRDDVMRLDARRRPASLSMVDGRPEHDIGHMSPSRSIS